MGLDSAWKVSHGPEGGGGLLPLEGFWVGGGGGYFFLSAQDPNSPKARTENVVLRWNTRDSHKELNPRRMAQTKVSTSYARCYHNPGGGGVPKGLLSMVTP